MNVARGRRASERAVQRPPEGLPLDVEDEPRASGQRHGEPDGGRRSRDAGPMGLVEASPLRCGERRGVDRPRVPQEGKPAEIVAKMVDGRMRKFLAENSLVEQAFVKDPDLKVGKLLSNAGADISSFVRYEVGEGIEKAEEDFAAEVAKQVQSATN